VMSQPTQGVGEATARVARALRATVKKSIF
jgi:hypothetical protein